MASNAKPGKEHDPSRESDTRRSPRPVALRAPAHDDQRVWRSTYQSGNINTNNNRRQVGPLQAVTLGPVQAITLRPQAPPIIH